MEKQDEFILKVLDNFTAGDEKIIDVGEYYDYFNQILERIHSLGIEGIFMEEVYRGCLRGFDAEIVEMFAAKRQERAEREKRLLKKTRDFVDALTEKKIKCVVGGPLGLSYKALAYGFLDIDFVTLHLSKDVDTDKLAEPRFRVKKFLEDTDFFQREYCTIDHFNIATYTTLYKEYGPLKINRQILTPRFIEIYITYYYLHFYRNEYMSFDKIKLDDRAMRSFFNLE